jgi:hypothetical protein
VRPGARARLRRGRLPQALAEHEEKLAGPCAWRADQLDSLPPLEGTLITADAMHCQQESARLIIQELDGDYLFGTRGNQSGILERAERQVTRSADDLRGGTGGAGAMKITLPKTAWGRTGHSRRWFYATGPPGPAAVLSGPPASADECPLGHGPQ